MFHIFVDLEFMDGDRKFRKLPKFCRKEIIQFGAVVLDDNFQEVDSFNSYVKPQCSLKLKKHFTEFTGITDEQAFGAPVFEEVLQSFCEWCLKFGSERIIYEWSTTDLHQILFEVRAKELEPSAEEAEVLQDWQDAQKIYGDAVETDTQIALETAVWTMGEGIDGRLHDALWDARNTSRVFALLQQPERVEKAAQMLHHGSPETKFSCTLGDLFDFSKLQLKVE